MAGLAVPDLADGAVLDLLEPGGGRRRAAVAHRRADALAALGPVPAAVAADDALAALAPLADGMRPPPCLADTGPGVAGPGVAEAVPGTASALAVPVEARGEIFGVLTLLRDRRRARFGTESLALAAELGRRAGAALAQARDHRKAQDSEARERTLSLELSALMAAVPAAVWIAGDRGDRVWMNGTAARLLHLSQAAPQGDPQGASQGVVADPDVVLRQVRRLRRGGEDLTPADLLAHLVKPDCPEGGQRNVELELRARGGSVRHLLGNVAPLAGPAGGSRGSIAAFVDVTAMRRAERTLRANEHRFREMADMVPAVVWTADRHGRVTYVNARWSDWTGTPATAAAAGRWADCVHPGDRDRVLDRWRASVADGSPFEVEYRLRTADGGSRWHLCRALPLRGARGGIAAWFGTSVDIEDRRVAEEELREARRVAEQADRAKSQFLAAASHDLRQPFQAMRLLLHLLTDRLDRPEQRELAHKLSVALGSGEELLRALLDISILDAGTVSPAIAPVELTPLLVRLVSEAKPQATAKGLRLRLRIRSAAALTDAVLLERMLRNVLSNAVKYTAAGGILVACRPRGDRVRVEVWDTGRGIPEDRLDTVFEEFVQLGNPERDRSKGLGLGLSIVRRAARMLGHPIRLISRPGRGTVFMIELPAARSAVRTLPPTPTKAAALAGTVLVVEDDALQRLAMQQLLVSWGLTVRVAGAVAAVPKAVAGIVPDLIITDLRLPGEANGFDAIAAVRAAAGRPVPALVLTGETGAAELRQAAERGHRLLHKPYSPRELRRVLEDLLPRA
ncbi:Complexhybrid Signal Transduction Protein [Rhodospirillum centenum SW]|uniref:histidine kinase n=1 Tax=Rhodospirillum centenum (strain ATCC 51521 / SW) TaxID=414684 RepID=B6IWM8_RHOCS|nr:Complexhybrid Signal Transduction Protein [Rhodospirillum centenum SW]